MVFKSQQKLAVSPSRRCVAQQAKTQPQRVAADALPPKKECVLSGETCNQYVWKSLATVRQAAAGGAAEASKEPLSEIHVLLRSFRLVDAEPAAAALKLGSRGRLR